MPEVRPGLAALEGRGHWGIKRGLENPRALLEGLGHPERAWLTVLVAGTNGKGSTGAFLAHALRACGLRVGWTTSPHLVGPWERIWVDGAHVGPEGLEAALGPVLEAEARLGLRATYFELVTAAALEAFRAARVDVALVEVGMGGRWDASNALDPALTVLTNVAMDHMAILGDTREAIGREKLCTARTGRDLVLGPTVAPQWASGLLECAPRLRPAPPLAADRVAWDHNVVQGHRLALAGAHQVENLATALEALEALRDLGLDLPAQAAWEGLEAARWPGRLWQAPGLDRVWMDGAHNLDGARAVAAHARACGVRPHLLFGAMGDKDLAGMADAFRGIPCASVTLAHGGDERYARARALREAWGGDLPVLDLPGVADWLRAPGDGIRLVAGSLYFLGDCLRTLGLPV